MAETSKPDVSLAHSTSEVIAALLLRFERTWDEAQIDVMGCELQSWPIETRRQALLLLVKSDLERRWQSGQSTNLEFYFEKFPELKTSERGAAELLFLEWELREQFGPPPDRDEFNARFPQHSDALQRLVQQAKSRGSAPRRVRLGDTSKVMSQSVLSQPAPPVASQTAGTSRAVANAPPPADTPIPRLIDSDLPERFGRYRIVRKLGSGGMGKVYLAEDTELERRVALKLPHIQAQSDPEFLERFEREAKTAAKLSHANICQVFDVGRIEGRRYLTMEYVDGPPLSKLVGSRRITDRQVVQLVRKISDGVGEAHRLNIIHRDLKPANIMLTAKGEPKVTDFGLACLVGVKQQRLTQSGMIIGTPAYMPLEQLNGILEEIGPHSDVYSLGIILYELLTGHLPFEVPEDAPVSALFAKILTAPADPPTRHRPDLDPHLESIVLKAIAKEHADRYRTMGELSDALGAYLKSRSAPAAASATEPANDQRPGEGEKLANPGFCDSVNPFQMDEVVPSFGGPSLMAAQPRATPGRETVNRWTSRRNLISWAAGLIILLGLVLWFRTGSATIEIQILSDEIEVTFGDGSFTVQDNAQRFKVTPGDHKLHIKSGDAEFDTDIFTLRKGSNPAVTVQFVDDDIVARLGEREVGRHSPALNSPGTPSNVQTAEAAQKPPETNDIDPTQVDVLQLLRSQSKPPKGGWTLEEDGLKSQNGSWPRIQIPYTPPAAYEMEMEVIRKAGGSPNLALGLIMAGRQFALQLDDRPHWYKDGKVLITGIDMFNGRTCGSNVTTREINVFRNDVVHHLVCRVQGIQVVVHCDGREVFQRDISRPDLLSQRPEWVVPRSDQLFVGTYHAGWTIRKWLVRDLQNRTSSIPSRSKAESETPAPADSLATGSLWTGRKRNDPNPVRPQGSDEPFRLEITARTANDFQGTILVNSARSYAVTGTITGENLSMASEAGGTFQQTFKGTLKNESMELSFSGQGVNGESVRGTASLTRVTPQ